MRKPHRYSADALLADAPKSALVVMGSPELKGSPFQSSLRVMVAAAADEAEVVVLVDDDGPNQWVYEAMPRNAGTKVVRWSRSNTVTLEEGWKKTASDYLLPHEVEDGKRHFGVWDVQRNEHRDRCLLELWLPKTERVHVLALHQRGNVSHADQRSLERLERESARFREKVIIQKSEFLW